MVVHANTVRDDRRRYLLTHERAKPLECSMLASTHYHVLSPSISIVVHADAVGANHDIIILEAMIKSFLHETTRPLECSVC